MSQQDADNAAGSLEARKAAVESARHNVQRLEQLQAFTRIYAPFDGVITARNTDVGALIDSGASGGAARELFHIASTDRCACSSTCPRTHAHAARPGLTAELTLTEFPGRTFTGTLVRTAQAIDVASRTLLVEIDVPNPTGELLPGAYAEVHFKLPTGTSTYRLPVNALMFRSEGLRVAVVTDANTVTMAPVTIGRDFGTEVEIVSGLNKDDRVIVESARLAGRRADRRGSRSPRPRRARGSRGEDAPPGAATGTAGWPTCGDGHPCDKPVGVCVRGGPEVPAAPNAGASRLQGAGNLEAGAAERPGASRDRGGRSSAILS